MFDAMLYIGMKRGVLTYHEINDAFSPEMFPLDEMEDLLNLLNDMGVKIVDHEDRVN